MKSRFLLTMLLVAVGSGTYLVARMSLGRGAIISPAYAISEASARQLAVGGQEVGEVLVGDEVVFRIRTSAGGRTPFQRAQTVAERLQQLMSDSLQASDITTGRVRGMDVVMAKGEIVVTADPAHARLNNTTPTGLAALWAQRLESAITGQPVTETPVSEKVVPIISVGSGTRVGGALVAGPRDRLDDVTAVAQIEGQFGNAVRARVLVPVSSENVVQRISRVPETSVIGLVDIEL
jgi:hypothetical protein